MALKAFIRDSDLLYRPTLEVYMTHKNSEIYNNLIYTLQSSRSDNEKFLIIKSLELYLLEYQVCKEHLSCPYGLKISHAAEFISSYFLTELRSLDNSEFNRLCSFAISTLEKILSSDKKHLDDIPEFRIYSRYFKHLKEKYFNSFSKYFPQYQNF